MEHTTTDTNSHHIHTIRTNSKRAEEIMAEVVDMETEMGEEINAAAVVAEDEVVEEKTKDPPTPMY